MAVGAALTSSTITSATATALTIQSAGTTAMTIDTSQNVGIGTTTPAGLLNLKASNGQLIIQNGTTSGGMRLSSYTNALNANGYMVFEGYNIEYGRFDSSGNLLVGTTTGSSKIQAYRGDAGYLVGAESASSAGSGIYNFFSNMTSSSNNTQCQHFRATTASVNTWYLAGNGTSTFSSDNRLKKNIETTRDGYLGDLMQLRVVKYNWNIDEEGHPKELGLIAQEVEKVFPGLVVEDTQPLGDIENPKLVKTSVLPFMLLKAIQELSAKNDALEARLAVLEAK